MAEGFSLFTALRFDPQLKDIPATSLAYAGWNYSNESPFYMLNFHRDRILRAATHWQWTPAIDAIAGHNGLANIANRTLDFLGPAQSSPQRVRILLSREGELTFEKYDTPAKSLEELFPERLPPPEPASERDDMATNQFIVVLDNTDIARSEYTHFKTTKRAMYEAARQRAGVAPTDSKEVLIINQDDNSIMEGTMTTPYFWRDGRWVTPPVSGKFSREEGSGGQDGTTRRWALERGLAVEETVLAESLVNGEQCWISNGVRGFISCVVSLKETTA